MYHHRLILRGGVQPLYDTFAGHFKPGSNAAKYPYANQSDEYSYVNGATGGSIQMFSKARRGLARRFGPASLSAARATRADPRGILPCGVCVRRRSSQ